MRNTGYITCVSHGGQCLEGPHASLVAQMLKNPPVVQETQGQSLGSRRSSGGGIGYPIQYFRLETFMN